MTLNLDRVFDLIESSKIPDWDKELVALAVEKAFGEWVQPDAGKYKVKDVELYGTDPFPYRIDLALNGPGGLTLVDWKTKNAGKLDDRWALRETRSQQAKLYAAAAGTLWGGDVFPLTFEIRGVTLEEKPAVKTLAFVVERYNAVEAVYYLRGVTAQREALRERKRVPWVKDESGCRLFGDLYKCEFEDICWGGLKVPDGDGGEKNLSYSSAKEFLRCPERYRLLNVLGKEEDEEQTGKGRTFHAAMEEIYRQLKEEGE